MTDCPRGGIDAGTGVQRPPDTADPNPSSATVTFPTAPTSIVFPAVAKAGPGPDGVRLHPGHGEVRRPAPTLTVPTGDEGTLSYSAAPATVCTVDETSGALTLVGAGECVVTATAAETANYLETTVTTAVTVRKALQALTGFGYTPATVTFGDTDPTLTVPTGGEGTLSYTAAPATVCTVDETSGALSLAGGGECVVTATAAETAEYDETAVTTTVTVTVLKVEQALTGFGYTPATVTFGDRAPTLAAPTGAEGPLSYSATPADVCTIDETSGALTWTGAGECVVTATAAETAEYDEAAAEFTVTVQPATLVLNVSRLTRDNIVNIAEKEAGLTIEGGTGAEPGVTVGLFFRNIVETQTTSSSVSATSTTWSLSLPGSFFRRDSSTQSAWRVVATKTGFAPAIARLPFTVDLTAPTAPTYTAPASLRVGEAIAAMSPAGGRDIASYSATGLPPGLRINRTTGVIRGTPDTANSGPRTARVTVTDTAENPVVVSITFPAVAARDQTRVPLRLDPIAGDDTVNIAEHGAGFTISGDTGSEPDVAVTVTVGTTDLTVTSASSTPATWSVTVPANAAYITESSVTVAVSATKTGFTTPSGVTRALAVDLTAPSIVGYTPSVAFSVGESSSPMHPRTTDTDIASYRATGLPPGLRINRTTGVIGGTPDTANASAQLATVTVTDTAGNSADVSVTFPEVGKGDQGPGYLYYRPQNVTFGNPAPRLDFNIRDRFRTTVSYSASPSGVCTVNPFTGALTLVGSGTCAITATAPADANYNAGSAGGSVFVHPAGTLALNLDPVTDDDTVNLAEKAAGFTISGDTGSQGGVSVTVTVTVGGAALTATSAASTPTTWSVRVPANATYITGSSGMVTVSAEKAGFTSPSPVTRSFAVDLTAPTVSYPAAPATLTWYVTILDMAPSTTDTDIGGYGATGLPPGLSIDGTAGVIRGTPTALNPSRATATVTVTDTAGNPADVPVVFPPVAKPAQDLTGFGYRPDTVALGDPAPMVIPPAGAVVGTLSYSAAPAEVCTVGEESGAMTLVGGVGECVVTLTVAETAGHRESTAEYTVTVRKATQDLTGFGYRPDTVALGDPAPMVIPPAGAVVGTLSYSAAPAEVCTVGEESGAMTLVGGVGECVVTLTVAETASHHESTAEYTVTVRKATQDLAGFGYTPDTVKFRDPVPTLTAPTGAVGVVSYGAAPAEVCTVEETSGALTLAGAGECVVTATAAETPNYLETAAEFTVTVEYLALPALNIYPIAGDDMLNIVENEDGFTISGDTGSESGVLVTVTVSTPGGVTVSADPTISLSVELTATSSANGQWLVRVPPNAIYITDNVVDRRDFSRDDGPQDQYISTDVPRSVAVIASASKPGFEPSTVERGIHVDLTAPRGLTYTPLSSLTAGVSIRYGPTSRPRADEFEVSLNPQYFYQFYDFDTFLVLPHRFTSTALGSDGVTYRVAGDVPPGLTFDSATGDFTGTPNTANPDPAHVTVTATDAAGNAAAPVPVVFPPVAKGEQALRDFAYRPDTVVLGDPAPTVTPPFGGDSTLSYAAVPPDVCTVEAVSGALTLVGEGECVVTATKEIGSFFAATATTTVTVLSGGTLPLNVNPIAGDDTVNIAEKAAGFTISGDTGSAVGASVTVTVRGGLVLTATSSTSIPATWSVDVPADAPWITGSSAAVRVNAATTSSRFTPPSPVTRELAVDLAGPTAPTYTAPSSLEVGEAIPDLNPAGGRDIASYRAAGLPSGLSIDGTTGVIRGTPDTADPDPARATVTVTDTAGNPATVAAIPFPAVAKGDQTLTGFAYRPASVTLGDAAPAVTPPTGVRTSVRYAATPTTVCAVGSSTGRLTIRAAGTCEITATARSSAQYNAATTGFTVTVQPAGTLALSINPIAGDDTVNIAEKAAGFSISGSTGREAGVSVTVTVATADLNAASSPFTVTSAAGGAWSVSVPADAAYITEPSVTVTASAAKTGFTSPGDVTRTLAVDVTAPRWGSIFINGAPQHFTNQLSWFNDLTVGVEIDPMEPIDPPTEPVSYSASGLPSGLSIDRTTGVISGTPDTAVDVDRSTDPHNADIGRVMTDRAGNTGRLGRSLYLRVFKGDQTLTGFGYRPATMTYLDAAPTVTAPTGARGTLSYAATPETVCTVDPSTGELTILGAGTCRITATAAGTANYNGHTATFAVTVQPNPSRTLVLNVHPIAGDDTVNIAEKAAGFPISGNTGSVEGVSVTVTIGGSQAPFTATSGAAGAWSVNVPADAAYITESGVNVTVRASKPGYPSPNDVTRTLAVDLTAPSAASYPAQTTVTVGVAIAVIAPTTTGTDLAAYRATGLPSGLIINASTGVISGTPDTASPDTVRATVTVTDTAGNPAADTSVTFPAVAKGAQNLAEFGYRPATVILGSAVPTVTAPATAKGTVSYAATPATVCTVHSSTGALTLLAVGACEVTATAAGTANYNGATATFTVTVQPAGTLALSLDPVAGDDTVNLAEKAAGFAISGDTGTEAGVTVTVTVGGTALTATSATSTPGAWSVRVRADAAYVTVPSVTVTVSAEKTGLGSPDDVTRTVTVDLTAPAAPTYTAPAALTVGTAIGAMSPSPAATGVDGYRATGLPSGLRIDRTTGVIGGTPDTVNPDPASATVTVTDAAGNSAVASIPFPAVAKTDQTLMGFGYVPATLTYGDAAPTVTAPTGVRTSLSYLATPTTVCTVDPSSGELTIRGAGACEITATAALDAVYYEGTATATVTVQAVDPVGVVPSTPEGQTLVWEATMTAGTSSSGDRVGFQYGGSFGSLSSDLLTYRSRISQVTAIYMQSGNLHFGTDRAFFHVLNHGENLFSSNTTIRFGSATVAGDSPKLQCRDVSAITEACSLWALSSPGFSFTDGSSYTLRITTTEPGPPQDLSGAQRGMSAILRWSPPSSIGGSAITGYKYRVRNFNDHLASRAWQASGGFVEVPGGPSATSVVATGLTLRSNTNWRFQVVATNDSGDGLYSEEQVFQMYEHRATLRLNVDRVDNEEDPSSHGRIDIGGDHRVNIAEKAAGFTISGTTSAGSSGPRLAGVSVTVTLSSRRHTPTELTTTSDAEGRWSVSVPPNLAHFDDSNRFFGGSVRVTVSAAEADFLSPDDVGLTIETDLTPPSVRYTAPSGLREGVAIVDLTPSTSNRTPAANALLLGNIASYRATGLPSGLVIDTTTGVISGTPDTADMNPATATVTVTDRAGNPADVPIAFPPVARAVVLDHPGAHVHFGADGHTLLWAER